MKDLCLWFETLILRITACLEKFRLNGDNCGYAQASLRNSKKAYNICSKRRLRLTNLDLDAKCHQLRN